MDWTDRNQRWMLASPGLTQALVLSLVFHLLLFSVIEFGRAVGWWNPKYSLSQWITAGKESLREITVEIEPVSKPPEAPLTFVEVPASQASAEPPRDAKFYSALNARAANPETTVDSNVPKIAGTQDKVPKMLDTPRAATVPPSPAVSPERSSAQPLQPAPPPVTTAEPREKTSEITELKPKVSTPGDTLSLPKKESSVLVKPLEAVPVSPAESRAERRPRPRRLAAVQSQGSLLVGEKMKQAGGVRRFGIESSFDVKSTEFGAYDAAIIAAIQKRWYDLLDNRDVPRSERGKVVLEFRLRSDGHITDMITRENEVGPILELMCLRAVQEPAPYGPWPVELRRLVGKDFREVRFVFHYN